MRHSTPGGRRPWVLVGAVLATLLLVGCGVSSQQQATRIEPDDVPFGLLEDQPTTTVIQAGRDVTVYLRSADRLVPVQRSVNSDAGLDELLSQVITGPTEIEESLGVTTAVPSGTIGSVETAGGTAAVDLADSFGDIRSRDQIFALGQIVYTLTGQPGIGSVRFTVDGEDVIVPLSDGRQSDDPLSRDDFDAIAPK